MSELENVLEVDFDDYEDDDDPDLLDDLLEDYEDDDDPDDPDMIELEAEEDDDPDDAERRRRRYRRWRRRRRGRSRAKGKGYYRRRIPKGYVTKKQLKVALARVGRDVRRNKTAINSNSRRIGSLSVRTNSKMKSMNKEIENTKQMFMLSSLLGGDKSYEVSNSSDDAAVPNGTTFTLKDKSDSLDKLLPIMMMGGFGGSGGKGGMMENPLMMVLMIDALSD